MLVLSRKKNESIVINDDITIVVVEIRGDKVRLGVEAPKEVPVHRREVFDAIQRQTPEQREEARKAALARKAAKNKALPTVDTPVDPVDAADAAPLPDQSSSPAQ